jgi:hypothetical protein
MVTEEDLQALSALIFQQSPREAVLMSGIRDSDSSGGQAAWLLFLFLSWLLETLSTAETVPCIHSADCGYRHIFFLKKKKTTPKPNNNKKPLLFLSIVNTHFLLLFGNKFGVSKKTVQKIIQSSCMPCPDTNALSLNATCCIS